MSPKRFKRFGKKILTWRARGQYIFVIRGLPGRAWAQALGERVRAEADLEKALGVIEDVFEW